LSLTIVSLLTSYVLALGCVFLKRVRGEPLPSRRWSLGRFGGPINAVALAYLVMIYIFMFFPTVTPVVPATMNWGVVMFVGIMTVATGWYLVAGRKEYVPPVALVRRVEDDWMEES
jgi:amino acid transporter